MTTPKHLALLLLALPSAAHASATYTILDEYTDRAPTGAGYSQLTQYSEYVDAGSVDASPFVFTKTTSAAGGIVFYGSTEFTADGGSNTYRLTATVGKFDFTSVNLLDLEAYGADSSDSTIPTITLTSSTGFTQSYASTLDGTYDFGGGDFYYDWYFDDEGVKTLNWNNVDWVDITSEYTKAKTNNFVLAVPEPSSAIFGLLGILGFATLRRRAKN